jgi:hypothetical protein
MVTAGTRRGTSKASLPVFQRWRLFRINSGWYILVRPILRSVHLQSSGGCTNFVTALDILLFGWLDVGIAQENRIAVNRHSLPDGF